jgi:predicted RNase H-like HicB family nuclease
MKEETEKDMKKIIDVKLQVIIKKEGNKYIAYSPALDLSTCSEDVEEAKRRFSEAVEIFFEEIGKDGTAVKVLTELGWEKVDGSLKPPTVLQEDKDFKILIDID